MAHTDLTNDPEGTMTRPLSSMSLEQVSQAMKLASEQLAKQNEAASRAQTREGLIDCVLEARGGLRQMQETAEEQRLYSET